MLFAAATVVVDGVLLASETAVGGALVGCVAEFEGSADDDAALTDGVADVLDSTGDAAAAVDVAAASATGTLVPGPDARLPSG